MFSLLRRFVIAAALAASVVPVNAAESPANAIFLVARRGMTDPNFRETVVLVTLAPRGAPIGVIINRPLEQPLAEALPDQPALKGRKETLYFGGPVERQGLVFLVRSPKPPEDAMLLLRDVYFTADIKLIERLLKRKEPLDGLRVFAGYSGWGPDQLQREIGRGTWYVVPADSDTVFRKDTSGLWNELIERAMTKHTRNTGRAGEREIGSSENVRFEMTEERRSPGLDGERFAFSTSRSPALPISRLFNRSGTDRR